ncbi:MAG: hypothetical protein WKG07_09300 [Hymenobacter sp.]
MWHGGEGDFSRAADAAQRSQTDRQRAPGWPS